MPPVDRGESQGGRPHTVRAGGSAIDAGDAGAGPGEVPARLADDLELGRGVVARGAGSDRAGALAALDARAGGDRGRELEVVRKYTCRWPIEEVHLVLKSGCQVEVLRLGTWDGLEKAVTVNAAVAARIVSLRDLRGSPRGRRRVRS